MKKAGLYFLGLVLVAAAAAVTAVAIKNSRSHDDKAAQTSSTQNALSVKNNKACQIFTAADARRLMGSAAKGGQNPVYDLSADLDVSTCTYNQAIDSGVTVSDRKAASLLVRAPKTQKGITSNDNEFGPLKPSSAQMVDGYGTTAYWDATHGQLNVLKNNNWYILSYGPSSPNDRTLQQTEQLADLLISKL